MSALANCIDQVVYQRADRADAPEILALQKVAYQTEVELYGDDSLPPLQQTLEDLEKDFDRHPAQEASEPGAGAAGDRPPDESDRMVFIKAVVNGKIIGSVRGYAIGDTAHLGRMIVHPYFRGRGIGRRLLQEIEKAFPHSRRFEAKTGHRSKRDHFQLTKLGYRHYKTEPFTPTVTWFHFEKERPPQPQH